MRWHALSILVKRLRISREHIGFPKHPVLVICTNKGIGIKAVAAVSVHLAADTKETLVLKKMMKKKKERKKKCDDIKESGKHLDSDAQCSH